MGYDLRQRLTGPHDSWIAVDPAAGGEVLAHNMSGADAADLLPLVMQVLLGKNETARASVLDFVEQDGAWLLVTLDTPEHRDIRRWLQGTGDRKASPPAVDPRMITNMFRAADPKPEPRPADPIELFTPPLAPAPAGQFQGAYTQLFSAVDAPQPKVPVEEKVGEFTRFFTTIPEPGTDDLERTKLYAPVPGSTPADEQATQQFVAVDPAPAEATSQGGTFTKYFAAAAPAAAEPDPAPVAPSQGGEFTQYFTADPGVTQSLPTPASASPVVPAPPPAQPAALPPPPASQGGEFTRYFASGPGVLPAPVPMPPVISTPPAQTAQGDEFSQYFTGDPLPATPRHPEAATQQFASLSPPPPVTPPQSKGEFTRMFAAGGEGQSSGAPAKPAAPGAGGEFTRMFKSGGAPPQPPPAAGSGATGIFDSPPAQPAAPPSGAVASEFTRILQVAPAEPAGEPKAKAPSSEKPKLAPPRVSPLLILFGTVVLLAVALVLGVFLWK
jgi:hypothetical protein